MKLKPKMLLSIGIPLIVIFTLMGTIIYLMASSGLKSAVEVGMEQRAGRYAAELDGSVQEKRAMVETIAQNWSAGLPQGDDLQQAVYDISARPGVFDFYVGFPDGSSVVKDQVSEGFDPRTRPWYKNAVNSKDVELSEVYQSDPDKTRVMTLSKAIYNKNGELVAVIGMDASVDSMTEILKGVKVGESGSLFVLGPDSEFIYHKKFTLDDPRLNEMEGGKYKELAARFTSKDPQMFDAEFNGVQKFYESMPIGTTGWHIIIEVPQAEAFASATQMLYVILFISLVALALLGGITYYFLTGMISPIEVLSNTMSLIAKGDLAHKLPVSDRVDEIGVLQTSSSQMVTTLRKMVEDTTKASEQVLASSEELTASSTQTANASQSAAEAVVDIAERAAEQSNIAEMANEVAHNMEAQTADIAKVVDASTKVADETEAATREGREALGKAVAGVENLATGAAKVGAAVQNLYDGSKNLSLIHI